MYLKNYLFSIMKDPSANPRKRIIDNGKEEEYDPGNSLRPYVYCSLFFIPRNISFVLVLYTDHQKLKILFHPRVLFENSFRTALFNQVNYLSFFFQKNYRRFTLQRLFNQISVPGNIMCYPFLEDKTTIPLLA